MAPRLDVPLGIRTSSGFAQFRDAFQLLLGVSGTDAKLPRVWEPLGVKKSSSSPHCLAFLRFALAAGLLLLVGLLAFLHLSDPTLPFDASTSHQLWRSVLGRPSLLEEWGPEEQSAQTQSIAVEELEGARGPASGNESAATAQGAAPADAGSVGDSGGPDPSGEQGSAVTTGKSGAAAADLAGPDPARLSKCSEKCSEHGTCNEELGECFCETNYAGPDCADLAMPSCHVAPNYTFVCNSPAPCECHRECSALKLDVFGQCFRGRRPDGTKETDLKRMFSGPRYVHRFNPSPVEHDGIAGGMMEPEYEGPGAWDQVGPAGAQLIPPDQCPHPCSSFSWCNNDTRQCECTWGVGEMCNAQENPALPCFNGCSGKGQCLRGYCKCEKGYFGIDCSLLIARDGKTRIVPRKPYLWSNASWPPSLQLGSPVRPKIYVYEIPGHLNTWQGTHALPPDMFMYENVWFLERLLNSPFRTADPEEADFFYIPLMLRQREERLAVWLAAKAYIQERWPYWNRTGGQNHIVMSTYGDWSACHLYWWGPLNGVMAPEQLDVMHLTPWGYTKSMHLDDEQPCFRPGKDIVIPPTTQYSDIFSKDPITGGDPYPNRTTFAYFFGSFYLDFPPFEKYTLSFGVRQELHRLYYNKSDTEIIVEDETLAAVRTPGLGLFDKMVQSVFCICPTGWGWGPRAQQSVFLGCIPVLIQPGVKQAFDGEGLDWSQFSVSLEKKDIPNLEKILKAIPEDEIEKKRKAMAKIQFRFVWASPSYNPFPHLKEEELNTFAPELVASDSFIGVMEALQRRLK